MKSQSSKKEEKEERDEDRQELSFRFQMAIINATAEGVKRMLAEGVDPNDPELRGSDGKNPALLAAATGQVDILRVLADAGCRLDEPEKDGCSALIWAARVAISIGWEREEERRFTKHAKTARA